MGNFRIEKLDGSLGTLSSPNGSIIQADGNVTLAAYRGASLHIFAGGSVFIPGVVTITGPETGTAGINFINETLTLSNGDSLTIDGSVHPTVDIRAGTTAFGSPDNTATPTSSDIFIRAINFDAIGGNGGRVFLTNQYQPNTSLSGDISIRSIDTIEDFGGGTVTIDSKGKITVAGEVNVSARNWLFGDSPVSNDIYEGNGGNVTLLANGDINLTRGSGIVSEGLLGGNITLKSGAAIYATNSVIASESYTNQPGLIGGDIKVSATSLFLSNAKLGSTAHRQANGGSVIISDTDSVSVTNGAQIGTEVLGRGKAGDVTITATNSVSLDGVGRNGGSSGVGSQVFPEGVGNGGNITINTGSLSITNGAAISTTTTGKGDAGSVTINATNAVSLDGFSRNGEASRIQSDVYPQADGKGGTIEIETGSLSVTNGAGISASTAGRGDAGKVKITATNSVSLDGASSNGQPSGIFSVAAADGKGGTIDVKTGSLSVTNGAQINASTGGRGNAGNVKITETNAVSLDGVSSNGQASGIFSATAADGKGGPIEIQTGSLSVTNGAQINATTRGQGDAGELTIVTGRLILREGAVVSSQSFGEGQGGKLTVRATDSVELIGTGTNSDIGSNTGLGSGTLGTGDAGELTINTGRLILREGAVVSSQSFGEGQGGRLTVKATDFVELIGTSTNSDSLFNTGLNSDTFQNGKGGDLTIDTKQLIVRDGAVVSTRTFGEGQGGNLTVKNSDSVEIINDGSLETSAVNPTDTGTIPSANAGNLTIDTKKLIVHNAAIGTSTFTGGKGGELVLKASDSVNVIGSFVSADTFSQGDAGSLTIDTEELIVRDGSLVSVSGFGEGNAGSIQINATEDVRISGDSRLATASFSSGKGGDINIQQARSLFLMDGAQITSQSVGTGAAGNISIHTRENLESDRSQITATTQSGDGGNINLTVGDLLLMRNNSQISTTAGNAQAGGNGGNININTPFLVAVPIENSDITANAFTGTGGTVNITFAGIYGLEFRPRQTPKSDITASSEYGPQGTFEVSDLTGIKAEQGLTNLPTEPVDRSRQIVQKCRSSGATAREKNQFIITGRGGLPPSPNEPLQSEAVTTNWVTLDSDIDNKTTPAATTPPSSTPKQLVEAQGWIIDDNGEIVLTTQAPTVTPQGEWFSAADCNMPQG